MLSIRARRCSSFSEKDSPIATLYSLLVKTRTIRYIIENSLALQTLFSHLSQKNYRNHQKVPAPQHAASSQACASSVSYLTIYLLPISYFLLLWMLYLVMHATIASYISVCKNYPLPLINNYSKEYRRCQIVRDNDWETTASSAY